MIIINSSSNNSNNNNISCSNKNNNKIIFNNDNNSNNNNGNNNNNKINNKKNISVDGRETQGGPGQLPADGASSDPCPGTAQRLQDPYRGGREVQGV